MEGKYAQGNGYFVLIGTGGNICVRDSCGKLSAFNIGTNSDLLSVSYTGISFVVVTCEGDYFVTVHDLTAESKSPLRYWKKIGG